MQLNISDVFIFVFCFVIFGFFYAIWSLKFFDRRSIKLGIKPKLLFGYMYNIFMKKEHFVETMTNVYNAAHGLRYTGFLALMRPSYFIRDIDLIKQVCVKDFDHFVDHKVFMNEQSEPLLGSNLFFLRGQKWRDMRATLSPAFTLSKMKGMYPLVVECAEQFKDFLIKQTNNKGIVEMEMKEELTRFTNDVIASTAFGFKINSFTERENEFYLMGKKATNFSGFQFFKFQLYGIFPNLMNKLKVPLFPKDVASYFRNLVHQTIKDREKNGIIRHDMIHLLMLARKGSLTYDIDSAHNEDARFSNIQGNTSFKYETVRREWNDDDITAQALAFIIAGFGTPSSMMCFMMYELAKNPEVQEKLQVEIDELYKITNGKPTYNDLLGLKYLDMVVSEILRLWPPDSFLERVCVKAYDLPPQTDQSHIECRVNVSDELIIPIFALHHDPLFFPEPEKFDPERFSDENKANIKPFSYIPFGAGPRLCIGARFSFMEAKTVIFHILAHFEFSVSKNTEIPFKLAKDTFNMHPENGLWLGVKRRHCNDLN